jgi:acylphosphatase
MHEPPSTEQRRVLYSGRVQGVGFRFTACRISQRYAVKGFVRNLADGKVELVVEGESSELDRFVGELGGAMSKYIRETNATSQASTGRFESFEIEY